MVERIHLDFVRAGAQLEGPAGRRRRDQTAPSPSCRRVSARTSRRQGRLAAELRGEADLAGLPTSSYAAAVEAARAWRRGRRRRVDASRSAIVPFLTFASERRDLRERAWRAWTTCGEQ